MIKPINKITSIKIDNTYLEKKHIKDKFSTENKIFLACSGKKIKTFTNNINYDI